MPYELRKKEIVVCGETLTVFEASNLMEIQRDLMITAANEKWQTAKDDGMDARGRWYLETLLYPSLIVCTEGNVPTLEEFTDRVPASETKIWESAVHEMNPTWIREPTLETPEAQEADLEKKDE